MGSSTFNFTFLNPLDFGTLLDFSQNPVYEIGSIVPVQWNGPDLSRPISVELHQVDLVTGFFKAPVEFIAQNVVNISSTRWTVSTQMPLFSSNVFILGIYQVYQKDIPKFLPSHYFNITEKQAPSAVVTTVVRTVPVESSRAEAGTAPSGGLSSAAGIGLGIGATLLVLLLAAGGYFLFRRRRRERTGVSGSSVPFAFGAAPTPGTGPVEGQRAPPETQQVFRYGSSSDGMHNKIPELDDPRAGGIRDWRYYSPPPPPKPLCEVDGNDPGKRAPYEMPASPMNYQSR
ncbi:hypothetical protein QBC47DRAFT_151350 [Echria macrotheca]|uniref:Peptidase A1 domain-containing protein n=1 Tax=Echria macrotheca TaxID=438768 RepID=A0AAJ0B1K7_9PEZI|nr:hypothetical protein QBC47DRAFT_151350 [Echria macrotheca]